MNRPRALIVRTAGTNCERELAHAFELAGAQASLAHINELIREPAILEQSDLIGFPGGFSYGDDIAAGRILANRLRHRLMDALRAAIDRGVPMIGICNGFQVLVKMGLLPDPSEGRQSVTLADNVSGRFIDRWLALEAPPPEETACVWTKGLSRLELPIAHGEGRFVPADETVLHKLRDGRQIALRYEEGHNVNGSVDRIAAICDPSGLVLGLMPHPERYTDHTHHPNWAGARGGADDVPPGLRFFQNAVEHVRSNALVEASPTPQG